MNRQIVLAAALALALAALSGPVRADALDTQAIEQLTGFSGKLDAAEGVFKVSYPRKDLHVVADGVTITPPFGTTCWAAFQRKGAMTMVMGDLVLTEAQVNPVMSVALDNGLAVTALHNHFFGDAPKVMFMHIGAMGDGVKLAAAVGKVFVEIKRPRPALAVRRTPLDPSASKIDPAPIEGMLGVKGELSQGVFKVTIGRPASMGGMAIGKAMGVNTWAAFVGTNASAVVDGDFAMTEDELQNVLRALRRANIDVVAIHNHMALEQPRIVFLHFWGRGSVHDLAAGLKAALDQTNTPGRGGR
ncbi:MAG: LppY/LpqO family protein [Cyanobacteria bacterium RYN_339]|nr:LppY/LpqO family protein [Cyanobacteria bacterium RYN_339]